MSYRVRFAPEAEEQLTKLYRYISQATSPNTALSYTEGVVDYCESLEQFPHRGNQRDDILSGLRITNYRSKTVVAFMVEETKQIVTILGIWHGGQDYESHLHSEGTN
ncbi:type II toxin-antitoxin system RelE/ParE family toxin [Candidatus Symbiopectobacterium sp. NZEC135]|uniref:type II toxin-antitoxin system RelE/ParE family toxin n=1 Tax=Candidatus Symbiopectobacterium sp. NZEC135 TaxID=2820471 RepID=UPI002226E224|nr:type II toxin-antitoxin system RelE/ParE family toxin [Candidatus Symbiopectobacterium sp. NZEC135]MCW2481081.1 type II toxin-antitoxin system RelE/ParE family toxin [Candidatus Symbiopectobacterium sp. NZEC135]